MFRSPAIGPAVAETIPRETHPPVRAAMASKAYPKAKGKPEPEQKVRYLRRGPKYMAADGWHEVDA